MKTIQDTILSFPGAADGEEYLERVMTVRSINGAAEFTPEDDQSVCLAVADVYAMLGGLPDFSENKLSMTYPRDWYTLKAKELYIENEEPEKADALGKKIKVPRGKAPRSW